MGHCFILITLETCRDVLKENRSKNGDTGQLFSFFFNPLLNISFWFDRFEAVGNPLVSNETSLQTYATLFSSIFIPIGFCNSIIKPLNWVHLSGFSYFSSWVEGDRGSLWNNGSFFIVPFALSSGWGMAPVFRTSGVPKPQSWLCLLFTRKRKLTGN